MAVGAAAVLIALLLGASEQYLTRFQKPYSFEARSEPTIEIVDAPIILDIATKPAVRNRVGRDTTPGKTSRVGTQFSNVTSTSVTSEMPPSFLQHNGHKETDRQRDLSAISLLRLKERSMPLHKQEYTD